MPRVWPASCDVQPTAAEKILRDSWDMSRVDGQPGLDAQVMRYLRGEQLKVLPKKMAREIQLRTHPKQRGVEPPDDDD